MATEEGRFSRLARLMAVPALAVSIISLLVSYQGSQAQKRVADRVWRAQLITTIYEAENCPTAPVCPPKASLRSREEAVRAYVTLQREYGKRIDLRLAFLSWMVFRGEDFSKSNLSGATLLGANFEGGHLNESLFVNADLTKASLVNADLVGADFTSASLQGADLSGADLSGARLGRARFGVCGDQQFDSATGEPYRSADLKGAKLKGAMLDGAFLCGVNLRGVDLSDAKNLTQEQINQVEGDKDTVPPPYLSRPQSWDK